MKLTQKQIEKFEEVRDRFIEEIVLFSEGIDFSDKVNETETRRKQWIVALKSRVNMLKVENIMNKSSLECGYEIAKYLYEIQEILLEEFSKKIPPFDRLIPLYFSDIYDIFIAKKP